MDDFKIEEARGGGSTETLARIDLPNKQTNMVKVEHGLERKMVFLYYQ